MANLISSLFLLTLIPLDNFEVNPIYYLTSFVMRLNEVAWNFHRQQFLNVIKSSQYSDFSHFLRCSFVQMRIQIRSICFNQLICLSGLIIYRFPLHLSFFLQFFVEETGWLMHRASSSICIVNVPLCWCVAYSSVSCTSRVRSRSFFSFLARLHHWWLCVFFKMLIMSVFVMFAALDAQCLEFLIHKELENDDSSNVIILWFVRTFFKEKLCFIYYLVTPWYNLYRRSKIHF